MDKVGKMGEIGKSVENPNNGVWEAEETAEVRKWRK